MLQRSGAAACDNRDSDFFGYRPCECKVIALFLSVLVHACQQNLACAQAFALNSPLNRVNAHRGSAAVNIDLPAVAAALCVNRRDNALTAELVRRLADKLGTVNRRGVYRNLVGSCPEQRVKIVNAPDSAAYGEGDKDSIRDLFHHINSNISRIARRGDVEEHKLIRALNIVLLCALNRIACVNEVYKAHTLYNSAVFYVEAGDNSFCVHL